MSEEEIRKKILLQELRNKELTSEKLELEIKDFKSSINLPFYRSPGFLRLLFAGISLSFILAAYIQYIFIPTQNKLTEQADTAGFVLQQNSARHEAELAKLELLKEEIDEARKKSQAELKDARNKLIEAKKQNTELEKLLEKEKSSKSLEDLKEKLHESKATIDKQLAKVQDIKVSIESTQDLQIKETLKRGWIYIGYFPNEKWQYKTINISEGMPILGKTYEISENVNIRSHPPIFSWFRYKFGDLEGFFTEKEIIKVTETKVVGNNKVWAKVETVSK